LKEVELVDWAVVDCAGEEDEEHKQQAACDEDERPETEDAASCHDALV